MVRYFHRLARRMDRAAMWLIARKVDRLTVEIVAVAKPGDTVILRVPVMPWALWQKVKPAVHDLNHSHGVRICIAPQRVPLRFEESRSTTVNAP
jgi:hypothetical protein